VLSNPAAGKWPIAAAVIAVLMAGNYVPSPLYALYGRDWGLSPGEISFVFAIFVSSLVPTLLFLGGISDDIGRRKTMLIALGIAASSALALAFSSNVWELAVGRVLQGVALGIGLSTATAAVREWMGEAMQSKAGSVALVATAIGSGLGATYSGALAQYAPHPTTLPYLAQFVVLACVAAAVTTVPSCPHLAPAAHHGLPSIRPAIRLPFFLAAMQAFIGWATVSIFVSLLPTFLGQALDLRNLLAGTAIVILVQVGMVSASLIGRNLRNRVAIVVAMLALGGGVWLLLFAVPQHLYALIALATLIVGIGNGLSYLAALNIVNAIAPPEHRAELLAALLAATNTGFALPAFGVGLVANYVGLYLSITGAAILLGVVAVVVMLATTERNIAAPTGS